MRRITAALLLCAPLACAGLDASRDFDVSAAPSREQQKAKAGGDPAAQDSQWHVAPSESGVAVELRF